METVCERLAGLVLFLPVPVLIVSLLLLWTRIDREASQSVGRQAKQQWPVRKEKENHRTKRINESSSFVVEYIWQSNYPNTSWIVFEVVKPLVKLSKHVFSRVTQKSRSFLEFKYYIHTPHGG
jgi:hypothetical protein